jgi:NAD(P)-dependent dehydrogenase (short-subunit alcohol dehydrogenase family)
MAKWNATDIPDLSGRRAVVTGANSGLGLQTAAALAARSAQVVLACRDQSRAEEARQFVLARATGPAPEVMTLDLADLGSVRAFSDELARRIDSLDVLVNNAGVMAIPRRETADGFEMQFGTNHLGHFALTGLLLDRLLTRPGARVVTVSSEMARLGRIRFDDLPGTRRYGKWTRYAQAKLANQLFTLELDRRATTRGVDLTSVAAHPGYAATNLQAVGPQMSGSKAMQSLGDLGNAVVAQTAAAGALPILYAATAPTVGGGQYFGPDKLFGLRGSPGTASFVRAARHPEVARHLWQVSEELTGVRYGPLDRPGPSTT